MGSEETPQNISHHILCNHNVHVLCRKGFKTAAMLNKIWGLHTFYTSREVLKGPSVEKLKWWHKIRPFQLIDSDGAFENISFQIDSSFPGGKLWTGENPETFSPTWNKRGWGHWKESAEKFQYFRISIGRTGFGQYFNISIFQYFIISRSQYLRNLEFVY